MSGDFSSSSSLLIRGKNPRRCQAGNPLKLLSEFAEPALSTEFLPVANSGIIGFSDHDLAQTVGAMVRRLHGSRIADQYEWAGDQPFFNYVLTKTKAVDLESLGDTCSFSGMPDQEPSAKGFMHFVWARGDTKLTAMRNYSDILSRTPVRQTPRQRLSE